MDERGRDLRRDGVGSAGMVLLCPDGGPVYAELDGVLGPADGASVGSMGYCGRASFITIPQANYSLPLQDGSQ